jgi:hypothetical protein
MMRTSITIAAFWVCVHLLVISGCNRRARERLFPTEQAAVDYFRAHQNAYRSLAEDWLASGDHGLYWFGWSDLHQETYTWNDYRVNPKSQWWEVTHWDGREYAVQRAESFEETAKLSGTSAEEVSRWHSGLQSLGVDMIARVRRTESGVPFSYIEIGYFPYLDPYGFRFVPPVMAPLSGNWSLGRNGRRRLDIGWTPLEMAGSTTRAGS